MLTARFASQYNAYLVLQDLTKDVFRIDAIPSQSLDTVREWLASMDIKFYENKVNLNWKAVLKSIIDVSDPLCAWLGLANLVP